MKHTNIILATILALAAASCAHGAADIKAAEDTLIDCAKADVDQVLSDGGTVLNDVEGILAAGTAGWESALGSIGIKAGEDALACAVKAAETAFSTEQGSGSAITTSALALHPDAAARASSYIQGHAYTYAPKSAAVSASSK